MSGKKSEARKRAQTRARIMERRKAGMAPSAIAKELDISYVYVKFVIAQEEG